MKDPSLAESKGSDGDLRLGANDVFSLDDQEHVWVVEHGYVDVFAARISAAEPLREVRRRPFVARVEVGHGFTGGPAVSSRLEPSHRLTLLAVPSRDAVVRVQKRNDVASPAAFDLGAVILIDNWVFALSEFVAQYADRNRGSTKVELLEADPDVPYEAGVNISATHLDLLWVSANRTLHFLGEEDLALDADALLPLTESTWFALPAAAEVTGIRTPTAIHADQLWQSLDRFVSSSLRISEMLWARHLSSQKERRHLHRDTKITTRDSMYRTLLEVLGGPSKLPYTGRTGREFLRAAVEAVAQASGAPPPLRFAEAPVRSTDAKHAVAQMIQPSGLRIRPVRLTPGWERRDGPSFLGFDSDDQRPVALINDGRAYQAFDPSTGETERVGPGLAKRIADAAVKFHAPLADGITTGLAATWEALRGSGRDIAWIVGTAALSGLLALLVPVLTGKLLGEIIPRVDWPMWVAALIGLALGGACTAVFSVVGALSMLRIETRVDDSLQSAVWSRLLSLPAPFFRKYLAGDLADRANGVTLIRQTLTGTTAASVIAGIFSLFSYILLFWYSAELALWAGALVIVLAAGGWFFATRQIRHHRAAFAAQGRIDGFVVQMINAMTKLRQTNTEVHLLARWAEKYAGQKRETLRARYWAAGQSAFSALFGPLATLSILALIWYKLIGVDDPVDFSLSDFLSFNSAFGQFVVGITGLTAAWTTAVTIIPLFERVQPILEAAPESAGTPMREVRGRVEFDRVTFMYPSSSHNVLDRVTFDVRPGERVAFVGPSGAGKSTIYRLLLGFEQPTAGTVLIDGQDLAMLDLASARRLMGVVLQHMDPVAGSIYKNIASNMALTMDEAWEAARMTGLAEDIESMPMGMHTMLPEGGGGISGGQKQKLLLARALASKPRVLLLDEPTSMLDNRSQATIQETLRTLGSTQIIIAHRLSTVQNLDRIYVLQDGRIVEVGSHDALMERDGVFAQMARRQAL